MTYHALIEMSTVATRFVASVMNQTAYWRLPRDVRLPEAAVVWYPSAANLTSKAALANAAPKPNYQ